MSPNSLGTSHHQPSQKPESALGFLATDRRLADDKVEEQQARIEQLGVSLARDEARQKDGEMAVLRAEVARWRQGRGRP
jgi:hypothetical protein